MKNRAINGTGSIYKDDRGRHVGQVKIDGKRYVVRGKTAVEARDKLNAKIAQVRTGIVTAPTVTKAKKTTTVNELLDEWITRDVRGRDLAPSTLTRHEWAVAKIKSTSGHRPIGDLTVADVEAALDHLEETEQLARASLTKILSTWKQALRYALRRGVVDRNVATDALVPAAATKPVARKSLLPDEARALLSELRATPDGLRFGLSLLIGLRPGEAAALQWRDVDLDVGIVSVNRSLQLDQRGRPVIVDDLKVESARRTIELPPVLIDWFREHATDHRRAVVTVPVGEALVFIASTGGPFNPTTSRGDLADACARAGVRRTMPNELRHSAASLLIDQGVPIERVADLLGHNSTRMVDLVYRHRVRPMIDVAPNWAQAQSQ